MNFLARLFQKVSGLGPVVTLSQPGSPAWSQRDYAAFARDAYQRNVIAFRAVKMVSQGAAKIPWQLMSGETEIKNPKHPLLKLLHRPNPWQAGAIFFEGAIAYHLLSGNTYLEGVVGDSEPAPMGAGRPPDQLFCQRPDRMKVVASKFNSPMGYVYENAGKTKTWDADPFTGEGAIVHWKSFNPLDHWYGMSQVEAAAWSVDQHNEASAWNKSLLQNSGSPSGALTYTPKNNESATLSQQQFERLKSEIAEKFSGTRNAGRPLLLDGGLTWTQMGLSPKEMDWIEGKHVSAREIALAFGVPPYLLGIPGDSTYNNYKEARQGLYEDTILPLLDSLIDHLNMTLVPMFGEGLTLSYDEDQIPALAPKRAEKWTAVQAATWLTTDEKREATGYEPIGSAEAEQVLIASSMVPLEGIMDAPDPAGQVDANGDPILPEDTGKPVKKPKTPADEEADIAKSMRLERRLAERMVRIAQGSPSRNGRH